MNKFKFEWQFISDSPNTKLGSVKIAEPKLTMEFQADSYEEVCRQFGMFLKGCGYEFKGEVGVNE
ncbi:MAG: hypothetical protein EBU90_26375 [Proteobacteria bacterium]|nr:hypothetical protein [Pseudomonadota bacterium]